MHHLGQKAGCVGASGEAEDVDVVAWRVIAHDEGVAGQNMVLKGDADCLVQKLDPFRLDL